MRFKKTTLLLTVIVLFLTTLVYAWPTSCPSGYIKLWSESTVSYYYPDQWYFNMFWACMDDGNLGGIDHTVLMESSSWSPIGYTWYASCCAFVN